MNSDWKSFDYSEMSVVVKKFKCWILIDYYSFIDIELIKK